MRHIEQPNKSSQNGLKLNFKDKDGNVTEERSREMSKSEEGSMSKSPNIKNRIKNIQERLKDVKDERLTINNKKDDDEKTQKRSTTQLGST